MRLIVNGTPHEIDVAPEMPLLWVLRDIIGLTGSKFGCGLGLCGACTVQLDGVPTRSCVTQVSAVGGREVTTIEGLAGDDLTPVQRAWLEINVPQCGYCQAGQIMVASALLRDTPHPTDDQIDSAMGSLICRCGTYQRIRAAIHRASDLTGERG